MLLSYFKTLLSLLYFLFFYELLVLFLFFIILFMVLALWWISWKVVFSKIPFMNEIFGPEIPTVRNIENKKHRIKKK